VTAHPQGLGGWLPIAGAWLLGTFGGGWLLARLYKRLHPELAFYKLWALWSTLLGAAVALLLALGLVRL
jgi:hypothetical protein